MNNETKKEPSVMEIAARVLAIQAELTSVKPLYEELDQLTLQLHDMIGDTEIEVPTFIHAGNRSVHTIGNTFLKVVDNFSQKNTVFRVAGVKRFEASSELVEERLLKEIKKIQKAKKS